MKIVQFKEKDRILHEIGDGARICWDVDTHVSSTMGCAVSELEDCTFEWTVTYDEYLHCISGQLTIETREGEFVLDPGDGLFLPEGTWLVYKAAAKTRFLVSVYPMAAVSSAVVPGKAD